MKSKESGPLSGACVLVGRARHQAGALSAELRKLGADVIEIPFIEIRKPRSFHPLDAALKSLSSYDWLILTSANGVEAMWERMGKLSSRKTLRRTRPWETLPWKSGPSGPRRETKARAASAAEGRIRIAAIGPATKKAIEKRGVKVDVVPKEYVAESVVRSLKKKVQGKRVLLVRAKVARDVIPRELRKDGAHVDVVEAYETVVPESSRRKLQAVLGNPKRRPHVVTFTSSSTVRNFVELLDSGKAKAGGRGRPPHTELDGIRMASIGPVTSATLREFGLRADIKAKEFTIPGLVGAIARDFDSRSPRRHGGTEKDF
ncbi:MAG TPA: uroporphyrinogen-III synthase [Verrucomicrobiae bacterium]|nr:uroporphyrinogen-III synthase [Verrucomicrobiae bacterium]